MRGDMDSEFDTEEIRDNEGMRMASTCVNTVAQANVAYKDMKSHFPYVGMARIKEGGHEWYVMGSRNPLQLREHPGPPEPTIGQLEAAITYLADHHHLYLWRVNECVGVAGEGDMQVGWAFARSGHRESLQGATITDAVVFNMEKIQKANREQQQKTQRELEASMSVASHAERYLGWLGAPEEEDDGDVDLG